MGIAFGRLKAQWRRLLKQNYMPMENISNLHPNVLHNICEIYSDEFNEEWLQEINENDATNPTTVASTRSTGSGNDIRNTLVECFSHNSL